MLGLPGLETELELFQSIPISTVRAGLAAQLADADAG